VCLTGLSATLAAAELRVNATAVAAELQLNATVAAAAVTREVLIQTFNSTNSELQTQVSSKANECTLYTKHIRCMPSMHTHRHCIPWSIVL
jgi:hypothetical protein